MRNMEMYFVFLLSTMSLSVHSEIGEGIVTQHNINNKMKKFVIYFTYGAILCVLGGRAYIIRLSFECKISVYIYIGYIIYFYYSW